MKHKIGEIFRLNQTQVSGTFRGKLCKIIGIDKERNKPYQLEIIESCVVYTNDREISELMKPAKKKEINNYEDYKLEEKI